MATGLTLTAADERSPGVGAVRAKPLAQHAAHAAGERAAMADRDTLRHAWRRFGAFDEASTDSQRRFLRLRRAILLIGVLVAAAGLGSTAAGDVAVKDAHSLWGMVHPSIRWLTFVASLLLAGLFAAAARVDRGGAWVLSRRSAEVILREIFLYRTGRGPYKAAAGRAAKLDAILAAQLRALSRDAPRQVGLATSGKFEPRVVRTPDHQPVGLTSGTLDDGLCALGAEDYARIRIADQHAWYRNKARRARQALRASEGVGILIGLGGAVLAFVGGAWLAWVAVSTAMAAAVASWTELRRLEETASAYEYACSELDDLLLWWSALPADERSAEENFDKLVAECEAVIEHENAGWTQDMRRRVTELTAEAVRHGAATRPGKQVRKVVSDAAGSRVAASD